MSLSDSLVVFRTSGRQFSRRDVRAFASRLARELAGGRTFCCMVAGDTELRRLNRQFRGRDYPADVLSFPSADSGGSMGDVAISLDRAREQAAERGHSVAEELKILMLHGVLHLLGMDHERDRGTMHRAEQRWRRRLDLPAGLIERARS